MPCKLCGDVCCCSSHAESDARLTLSTEAAESASPQAEESGSALVPNEPGIEPPFADPTAWRQELSVRLNRYQSRRKPKPPRYPSLRLRFEPDEYTAPASPTRLEEDDFTTREIIPIVSNQALALDQFAADFSTTFEQIASSSNRPDEATSWSLSSAPANATTGKLLEFPRSWTPPVPPLDELAEPVITRPRILEAPEIVPPPPALGGITMEPADRPELEKRPGIDIPLQTAPLIHRIFSAVIDNLIIAGACTIFAAIFWKMTAIQPLRIQILGFLAGLAAVLWGVYHYILVIYAGTTPGLRLMHLELSRFDGSPTNRRLRRWRVLASFLSAISLGMGYGWVFLDEDSLCWHDRITHSYLAPVDDPKNR
jgi:uncharacterized RDD family membrane protein YckC